MNINAKNKYGRNTSVLALSRSQTERIVDRRSWGEKLGLAADKLDSREFRDRYPFTSQLHMVPAGAYHYLDEGRGQPVVMIHGNPTWSFFYRNVIKDLRRDFRCLAPDHLGCGLSEKPQDYAEYTLEKHIDNLESWLEDTLPSAGEPEGKINLIVHDWGGPIGLGYAVRHPERLRKVVVLNTSAFTAGAMPFLIRMCRWPGLGSFLVRSLNLFSLGGTRTTTVKPLPPPARQGFLLPYNSYKNRIAVHGFVKDIPLSVAMPSWRCLADIEAALPEVLADTPLLVQWGMKDWCFTPFFLNLWKQAFPLAEVDEYQAGHYLLEDAGDRIIPKIRAFLER